MNSPFTAEKIMALDPSGMYEKIYRFPEQMEKAAKTGRELKPNRDKYRGLHNVVVAGMGGSAIGGDLVRSYLADKLPIPFLVCRHYRLPNFVDKNSLVIVSSYSGNTEETISACEDAIARKAKVICLTSGGEIASIAKKHRCLHVALPPGYPPRAALGFSFVPLLYLLSKLGLAGAVDSDVTGAALVLKSYRKQYAAETEEAKNPAKRLAHKLHNRIPIIYTGPDRIDAIGTRWKGQICENAKCLAFNNQFPEFNHNELVGWKLIDAIRDRVIVVYLRDREDHMRVSMRMGIVRGIIEKQRIEIIDVPSLGDFPLVRMFSLIQLGDFVSFYLAILNRVDPSPVEVIDFLKSELENKQ